MTKQQFKTAIALGYSDARSDETIRIFVENTLVTAQITNRQAALCLLYTSPSPRD